MFQVYINKTYPNNIITKDTFPRTEYFDDAMIGVAPIDVTAGFTYHDNKLIISYDCHENVIYCFNEMDETHVKYVFGSDHVDFMFFDNETDQYVSNSIYLSQSMHTQNFSMSTSIFLANEILQLLVSLKLTNCNDATSIYDLLELTNIQNKIRHLGSIIQTQSLYFLHSLLHAH